MNEVVTSTVGTEAAATKASSGPKINGSVGPWLQDVRKISPEISERLPVASGITFFPELNAKSQAIFFKYPGGWKARAVPEKAFVASSGLKPTFWNLEAVLQALEGGPCDVYITEGEMDALALAEAGIPDCQILSVPSGAKSSDPGTPIPYVRGALEQGLSKASKIIWCGDEDTVGLALREQMVCQFGVAKFWFVKWPNGRKDANEVLVKEGYALLMDALLTPQPWPSMGLYTIDELPEPPSFTLWTPSLECLRDKVYVAPKMLSVVTGQPGFGKTVFMGQFWYEIIHANNLVGCFASFETGPKPHIRRQLRTLYNGIPEYQQTDGEKALADRWIKEHYLFMVHHEQRPSLDWFLEQSEIAVIRHGAQIIQLDPWNRMEAARARNETETEYIARCIRAMHSFAKDMNCHVQIIAHPAKMDGNRRGTVPELEDISGSKNWQNMPDQGFVIHRPKLFDKVGNQLTKAQFIVRKARFEELGYPTSINIDYDINLKRYVPDYSSDLVEEQ